MLTEILQALASLLIVLGLLGLFAYGVKRYGLLPGQGRVKIGKKQLDVIESKMLDGRNRLVIIGWRGKQYLLGTNPGGIRLIASDSEDAEHTSDEFNKLVSDNDKH